MNGLAAMTHREDKIRKTIAGERGGQNCVGTWFTVLKTLPFRSENFSASSSVPEFLPRERLTFEKAKEKLWRSEKGTYIQPELSVEQLLFIASSWSAFVSREISA